MWVFVKPKQIFEDFHWPVPLIIFTTIEVQFLILLVYNRFYDASRL